MSVKEIIDSVIHIESNPKAEKKIKNYITTMYSLKTIGILLIIAVMILYVSKIYSNFVYLLAIITLFIYYAQKKRIFKFMLNILEEQCDPDLYCSYYYALIGYSKRNSNLANLVDHIWNITRGLVYMGKWQEAYNIVIKFVQRYEGAKNMFWYNAFMCKYFYQVKNMDELKKHADIIVNIKSESNMKSGKLMTQEKELCMSRVAALQLEMAGDYENLYKTYFNAKGLRNTKIAQVENQFNLALWSRKLNNTDNVKTHLQYVIDNGNKTYFVKEAEKMMAELR